MIVSDFHREYRIRDAELADMGTFDFLMRVQGLSAEAVFRHAARDDPPELDESAAARALGAPTTKG